MSLQTGSVAHELHVLQGVHVLILGDIMLDRYLEGEVQRISPEAPVPVLLHHQTRLVLGGAANVAANVTSMGARATLVGRIGMDDEGQQLVKLLEIAHVEHHLARTREVPTTTKTRLLAGSQQLARTDHEVICPATKEEESFVLGQVHDFLNSPGQRAVVLADYAKGFLEGSLLHQIIDGVSQAGIPVVVDPKGSDLLHAGATVVKPNLGEARLSCGVPGERYPTRLAEAFILAEACLRTSGAINVVLSCSADGVVVQGADVAGPIHLPTNARDVADVSGAGDTLVAFIALSLAAEFSLRRAVEVANVAAGVVCGKAGTATVNATELLSLLGGSPRSGRSALNSKILGSCDEAGEVGAQYRKEGRTLVFANGCFDLLHAGHIKLLREAKMLGDALMVALNADGSVRRLKGPRRPIQSETDRCEIMAALACVDFVVLFEEDTPLPLIEAVRPHILVKGDDYELQDVVGASEVESWGGSVALIGRLDGRSTTRIIGTGSAFK